MIPRFATALTVLVVFLAAVACGGSGGSTNATPSRSDASGTPAADTTPAAGTTPAPFAFDPNLFPALVLRPSDVPADLVPAGRYSPKRPMGAGFTSYFYAPNYYIQSTIGRFASDQDAQFAHLRKSFDGLVGPETNFDVPGADLAYKYAVRQGAGWGVLVLRGDYIMTIVIQSPDGTAADVVLNQDTLLKYTSIILARIQQAIDDPSSVVLPADSPRYEDAPVNPGDPTTPPAAAPDTQSTPTAPATP